MKILNVLFSKLLVNRVAGVCVLRPSIKDDEADGADEVSPVPTKQPIGIFFYPNFVLAHCDYNVLVKRW